MIALIQRVTQAEVIVEDKSIGRIGKGILALIAVEKTDTQQEADRLIERLLHYRIFADTEDKMNLNVQEVGGGILLVSQFTLAADTKKGRRPSFTPAADPEKGESLFTYLVNQARSRYAHIETGKFGANMQVMLVNDGPVTFILRESVS